MVAATLEVTYHRKRPEDDHTIPEQPNPWCGEWELVDSTPITTINNGEFHETIFTYRNEMRIWEKSPKHIEKAVDEWKASLFYKDTTPGNFAPNNWFRKNIEVASIKYKDANDVAMRHNIAIPWRKLVDPKLDFKAPLKWKYTGIRYDLAFEVLLTLYQTAKEYKDHNRWAGYQASSLLNGRSRGDFGFSEKFHPVTSFEDVKTRYHYALLASMHGCYERWRQDHNIELANNVTLIRAVPAKIEGNEILGKLFNINGCETRVQLNPYNPKAIKIRGFGIGLTREGFSMILRHGYQGSSWNQIVAETRFNEPFAETLKRAYNVMKLIMPDMDEQLRGKYEKEREKLFEY